MMEYKIMFNQYNGLGDYSYATVTDLVKAIEVKKYVEDEVLKDKGIAWIEAREVSEWKKIKIK